MKTPEEIKTLKESLRLPTAFAYQTATQRMALEYIEQLESINKDLLEERELNDFLRDKVKKLESQVPRWISVEDNPSDGTKDVIAYNAYGEMMIGRICATATGYKCEDGYSEDMLSVTHWMPIPEPPKEL